MKAISCCTAVLLIILLQAENVSSQGLTGYNFKVVNMMPKAQSNETNFDSETNIAVNPATPSVITGSAFTVNPTGSSSAAPIYVSIDGGTTWALNNILPSGNGMTGDVSLGFASTSGNLYAGILRGGSSFRCMILRTNTPSSSTTMTTLQDRSTVTVDQPFVTATTINDASATARDRVYSGDNLYGSRKSAGGNGKTAEVMVSNDAAAVAPAGFANDIVEVRTTFAQDMPAIRTAVHSSGVVYAVYYSWTSGSSSPFTCDVVVVRDDNFASGSSPFISLSDAGDTKAGQRVVTGRTVPAFGVSLGNNRLVASNLAIAVDPNHSATVYIAWCDRVSTSDYTLHVRESTNSGQAWGSSDLITVTNATNPGLGITNNGKVGLMYQQLTGSGSSSIWETHFRVATVTGTTFTDDILSQFANSDLSASPISPSLGDYLRIQAVSNTFYGVFPASNRADSGNFPHSVTYQRNADFTAKNLRNLSNSGNVSVSVDPFFFRVSPSKIVNFCALHPEICLAISRVKDKLTIPEYGCKLCPPDPCLSCPYQIDFGNIYEALTNPQEKIQLANPYFHLQMENYDPQDFELQITTQDGEPVAQELNKTDQGYTISFRAGEKNYSARGGMHGLFLAILPKSVEAAKKGAQINYHFAVSDYRFKEFAAQRR